MTPKELARRFPIAHGRNVQAGGLCHRIGPCANALDILPEDAPRERGLDVPRASFVSSRLGCPPRAGAGRNPGPGCPAAFLPPTPPSSRRAQRPGPPVRGSRRPRDVTDGRAGRLSPPHGGGGSRIDGVGGLSGGRVAQTQYFGYDGSVDCRGWDRLSFTPYEGGARFSGVVGRIP
jgi:hypothetical protein